MSDSTADPAHRAESGRTVRVGRGVFLAAVAGGVSSLLWGKSVWSRVSGALSPVESLVPLIPTKGWRIYTVADSMPKFDEADWQLTVGGLVEQPADAPLRRAARAAEGRAGLDLPLRHRLDGEERPLGRRADRATCSRTRRRSARRTRCGSSRPRSRTTTSSRSSRPALHDVMLAYEMDGKPLPRVHGAPLRLVIPEMYGYKNVKWVSRIELVPKAGQRLLGGARLRPRRLGRPLQRVRHMSASQSADARAAPDGSAVRRFSRTERALHWANALGFFVLLASGLVLYLPSLAVAVGRRPLVKDIHFWSGIGWVDDARADRRARRPARARAHGPRARRLRPRRPPLADAAGSRRRRAASTPGRS